MNYGFVKVASAIPSVRVADCNYNEQHIESLVLQAEGKGVDIHVPTSSVSNSCSTAVRKPCSVCSTLPAHSIS